MRSGEHGRIARHNEISSRGERGARRKAEIHRPAELPAGEVHRSRALVIQFDPLFIRTPERLRRDRGRQFRQSFQRQGKNDIAASLAALMDLHRDPVQARHKQRGSAGEHHGSSQDRIAGAGGESGRGDRFRGHLKAAHLGPIEMNDCPVVKLMSDLQGRNRRDLRRGQGEFAFEKIGPHKRALPRRCRQRGHKGMHRHSGRRFITHRPGAREPASGGRMGHGFPGVAGVGTIRQITPGRIPAQQGTGAISRRSSGHGRQRTRVIHDFIDHHIAGGREGIRRAWRGSRRV